MSVNYPFKKHEESHRELYDELFDKTINIFSTTIIDSEITPRQGEDCESTLKFIDEICLKAKKLVKSIDTNGERCSLGIKVYHIAYTPDRKFIEE